MLTLAICIATHERSHWLVKSLESIASQDLFPDEIVISDSSNDSKSQQIVDIFAKQNPHLQIRYCKSERKSLPWQRWWAFSNSSSDIILFIDDDIRLDPSACSRLFQVFSSKDIHQQPVSVGFVLTMDDTTPCRRIPTSWHEHWLGTSRSLSGEITNGGLTIVHAGLPPDSLSSVRWLWGGGMAYQRQVLDKIGPLNGLFELYDVGIGKGEDAVLSVQASHYGELLIFTNPIAFHPPLHKAEKTANSHSGWLLGLRETVGRAHTMRWISTSATELKKDWVRVATRQVIISVKNLLYTPFQRTSWSCLAGCLLGFIWCISHWNIISDSPNDPIKLSGIPRLQKTTLKK